MVIILIYSERKAKARWKKPSELLEQNLGITATIRSSNLKPPNKFPRFTDLSVKKGLKEQFNLGSRSKVMATTFSWPARLEPVKPLQPANWLKNWQKGAQPNDWLYDIILNLGQTKGFSVCPRTGGKLKSKAGPAGGRARKELPRVFREDYEIKEQNLREIYLDTTRSIRN